MRWVASADVRDECAFAAGFEFGEFVFNFQIVTGILVLMLLSVMCFILGMVAFSKGVRCMGYRRKLAVGIVATYSSMK